MNDKRPPTEGESVLIGIMFIIGFALIGNGIVSIFFN